MNPLVAGIVGIEAVRPVVVCFRQFWMKADRIDRLLRRAAIEWDVTSLCVLGVQCTWNF